MGYANAIKPNHPQYTWGCLLCDRLRQRSGTEYGFKPLLNDEGETSSLDLIEFAALSTKFRVLNTKFRVLNTKFRVLSTKFRVLSTKFRVLSTKFRVLNTKFRVLSTKFRVLSMKFRVLNTKFRVLKVKTGVSSFNRLAFYLERQKITPPRKQDEVIQDYLILILPG